MVIIKFQAFIVSNVNAYGLVSVSSSSTSTFDRTLQYFLCRLLSRMVPQRLGKRPTNHRSRPFTVSIVRYHHCTSRFQSPFCFFSFVPDTIVVIPLYLLHCSVTLLFYCSPSAIVLTVDINPSTRYLETSVSTSCLQVSLTCISLVDTSLNTTCLQPCVSSLAPLSLHKRSSDALARLVVPSSSRLTPGRDTERFCLVVA